MTSPTSRLRLQFSLRWFFVVITALSICAFVFRLAGAIEAFGVAFALLLLGIAVTQFKSRWLRAIFFCAAALLGWMVGVDYSQFREGCGRCRSHWVVAELRVFHQPVWSHRSDDHFPFLKRLAEDLGAPCPHRYTRFHKIRLWGLAWPGPPFINGTCCLASKAQYHGDVREQMRALGQSNPKLSKELEQALRSDDFTKLRAVLAQLQPYLHPESTSEQDAPSD